MADILVQTYYIALPILLTYIVWLLQRQKQEKARLDNIYTQRHEQDVKEREANSNGTKLILLYMLERMHFEYMYQQFVTHEQRDRFEDMYNAYHNLGGNGYGTRMYDDVMKLPIRNDKTPISPYIELLKGIK